MYYSTETGEIHSTPRLLLKKSPFAAIPAI